MKACISSWGYRKWFDEKKCDFMGFIDQVKRHKADGFEIFSWHLDQGENYAKEVKEIAKRAKAEKLLISALIVGNDFGHFDIHERAKNVDMMIRAITTAAACGIKRLNVFTGYHRPDQDPEMEVFRVVDCYRQVAPLAEEKGILLCMENHSSIHPDVDGLLWLFRKVGSPMLRPNPDPTNFCPAYDTASERQKEVIYKSLEKFAPGAANAHLKIRDFTPKGEHAHVDMARLAQIYKAAKYTGPMVLEYHGETDPVEPIAKGVKLIRKYFGA
jgi:sugar phosphate isomerase/epimerase